MLNPTDRQKLINIAASIPALSSVEGQKQILELAGLDNFIPQINFQGNTEIVVGNIVRALTKFKYNERGELVLRLFVDTIKQYTGYPDREFLYELLLSFHQKEKEHLTSTNTANIIKINNNYHRDIKKYKDDLLEIEKKKLQKEQEYSQEVNELKDQLEQQKESNRNLINQLESLQATDEEVEKLKEQLKQKDDSLQNLIQSRDNSSTQSEELKEKITNYETKINQLEDQGKQVATRVEQYQSQLEQLNRELSEKTKQLESTQRQLEAVKSTYQQNLQQVKDKSQQQIQAKQTEINNLKAKLEQLQKQEQALEIELKSDRNVDYTKLRDLLAAQKWQEADEETANVMLQIADRTSEGWLRESDIESFPCEDLLNINRLWLKYSDDKFGFGVQKKIYESLGGKEEYNHEIWKNFGERVGWIKGGSWLNYSELTMDISAPEGHLPFTVFSLNKQLWLGWEGRCTLLLRKEL